jgi:hypothetical protein
MSSSTATVDAAFEMFTCYKDGRDAAAQAADRKGMSCWAVGFH